MKMMLHRGGGEHWCPPSEPPIPCSPCTHPYPPYWTIGRVKFGVSLEQVCKNDIPGPLLVLILKLNKEGPTKKDVFRAPGHQGSMKKLIHFLQNGRLVNIDNFSVYTIASVLKKFLRKLPEGIFGREGEQELFSIIQLSDTEQQRDHIHRLITSMPVVTQHLLVLLFGTFRVIAMNATRAQTGMTSEALGVSVAPSFFQSCVADGKTARMEDVMRFKVATQIMKFLIDNFGVSNLFGRANYEYYARITGRILKVEEDWIFAFRYPPDSLVPRQRSIEAEKTWLQYESERWGLKFNLEAMAGQEESQSTPALIHIPESTSGLPLVHERQTERMRTRSEWFLSHSPHGTPLTPVDVECQPHAVYILRSGSINRPPSGGGSSENVGSSVRRTSSKDKDRKLVRRSSSKKDKENGQKGSRGRSSSADVKTPPHAGDYMSSPRRRATPPVPDPSPSLTDHDCTETDVQRVHVSLTYKPRI
ncbi:rho GTPase-activating protein gacW isoform X15 [Penaeus vannamei]|uniref:rho GTPase-activating protein gacW isoform X15 n=1 Tax=Penaeus vannamei TaxID=6689 RepID=UPI00387F7D4C